MNGGWWRIGDGRNGQRCQKMLFEFMRKEVESGGGDIKERECLLGGRENLSGGGK